MYCNNVLGFRGLQRVMTAPEVNFLSAPTSYSARRGGDPGNHISAYNGSMRLHSKLYWDEADNRTHLFPGLGPARTETIDETLATLRRTVGHSLTRGTGLWCFLLAGNTTLPRPADHGGYRPHEDHLRPSHGAQPDSRRRGGGLRR